MSHVLVKHQLSMQFELVLDMFLDQRDRELFFVRKQNYADSWPNSPPDSYLSRSFGHVVVIVGGQVDVFMNTVQQPQEELQGVVLGITTKLCSILGHYSLERGKAHVTKVLFLQNYYSLVN